MGSIWQPAVPLRLQVRPLWLKVRLLVWLPCRAKYKEPIVEQLGQDTPSVIQGARPQQRYGSQPYFSGQQYTAPTTAAQPCTAVPQSYTAVPQSYTAAAQPYIAPYNNMPAMSARPTRGPQGDSRLKVFLSVGVTLCLPPGSQN